MSLPPREIGTLIVVVLKAKNLPNKRHIGKQAPYCCAYLNEEKRRTKAIKRGGQHPEWDEEFRFTLYEAIEDELAMISQLTETPPPLPPKKSRAPKKIKGGNSMRLQCYADDPREPDLIGEAMVDLTEVLTKGETDEWFTLMNKDKYAGEVYVELTFWSNEPPPVRRNAPKPPTGNSNYGGPGNFVPANGSTSSLNGSSAHSTPSRLSVSSNFPDSHLPSTIRSSHSRAELYAPSYEQRNHVSPVDQLANVLGELGVMDLRRRESFPPAHTIRASTTAGFNSLPSHPHSHDQHTLANGTSTFLHDGGRGVTPSPSRIPSGPTFYYSPYENGSTPSHSPVPPSRQGQAGPRYSLPASSSGFVPISSPAPALTSFGTISSYSSESSGLSGQERPPLPIPPSPANNSPPHQTAYTSYPPPLTPGPPVPPPNASHLITHSFSTPQLHSRDQYQYADPHGQTVDFPSQEYVPPASGLKTYQTYTPATPSPSHDYASAPRHITIARGSRPLPQPQTVNNAPRTRHLSMAVPPSSSFPQSLLPGPSGGTNFAGGSAYQNIPPPPPLPTQYPAAHTLSSQEPQNPCAISHPPLPTRPAQLHSNLSPVRQSLPQPPMGYHPVQSAYQPLPQPPPPPPVMPRQGQLPPPPLLSAPPANHSYFPGPPPRSPHIVDHSHWGQQGSYGQPASTQGDWQ